MWHLVWRYWHSLIFKLFTYFKFFQFLIRGSLSSTDIQYLIKNSTAQHFQKFLWSSGITKSRYLLEKIISQLEQKNSIRLAAWNNRLQHFYTSKLHYNQSKSLLKLFFSFEAKILSLLLGILGFSETKSLFFNLKNSPWVFVHFAFNWCLNYLVMKAAATVRIFEFLKSATTVKRLPITPTIMTIRVITPAAVNIGLEYLKNNKIK